MIKRLALFAACLFVLVASARAFAQEPSFTLTVSQAELQVIGKGLESQPYGVVAQLMAKLQAQVIKQQQPMLPRDQTTPMPDANGDKTEQPK